MALDRSNRYPGRFENPTTAQPQGAFKNRTSPTSQDGSYFEADWANDMSGFFGAILSNAGVSPNGSVDTASSSQVYDALKTLFLQLTDPFGDIKSAGTVDAALKNLGLGRIASVTDIQAGTPGKLIDVKGLRTYLPTKVMQESGFMRIPDIPGGTLIQWGQVTEAIHEGTKSVVLPTPFPNSGRFAIAIPLNAGGKPDCDMIAQLQSASTTQINFYFSWAPTHFPADGFQWLAIGY